MKISISSLLAIVIIFLCLPLYFSYSQEEEELQLQEEESIKKEEPVKQEPNKEEELLQEENLNVNPEDTASSVPERLKYYKEKYEESFELQFEIVWQAVKRSIMDINCMIAQEKYQQDDKGYYKGSIKSDYCVFSAGSDSTFNTIKKYSLEVPYLRGGIWLNGRMTYKFRLHEEDGGRVKLVLTGEISGFEDFVTHEVHFWKSNGIFETRMIELVKKNIELVKAGQ